MDTEVVIFAKPLIGLLQLSPCLAEFNNWVDLVPGAVLGYKNDHLDPDRRRYLFLPDGKRCVKYVYAPNILIGDTYNPQTEES